MIYHGTLDGYMLLDNRESRLESIHLRTYHKREK